MNELLNNWVQRVPGISGYEAQLSAGLSVLMVLIGASLSYYFVNSVLIRLISKLIDKSKSNLDDILVKHQVFNRLAYLVPGWLIYKLMPVALQAYPTSSLIISTLSSIFLVLAATMVADCLINSLVEMYRTIERERQIAIQSFAQVAKLVLYFLAAIVVISLIIGESPLKLFAGLGAMTAVLMLVFKDPILGFVAGLQLSYNKMVSLGDWVDIPQHDASGDVMEIGLTTVKVRNFDNTITTVPTQNLVTDSFKNWRGMQDSAGRRIKRSIVIDINSIGFCDKEQITRFSKVDYIKDYLDQIIQELDQFNQKTVKDPESMANGRRITNIGTFRAYILAYLKNHPDVNRDLTVMVRQLAATESGVPLEIYAFSAVKEWAAYEAIQSDIFDHLFAVAGEFDLKVFQKPSGSDLSKLV
jgi:miniconductance mechanosensitive channel